MRCMKFFLTGLMKRKQTNFMNKNCEKVSSFTSSLKNLMKYSKEISLFSENTCSGWVRQTWYDF